MPEHLKALVVIITLAGLVFLLAEKPICSTGVAVADYRRRRNLWFVVTLIAFLTHNFWLCALLTSAVVFVSMSRERNPLALYVTLLFAVPPYDQMIPGFGILESLFSLNHVRLINLVILLPVAWRLFCARSTANSGALKVCDVMVAAYLGYVFLQQLGGFSLTGALRGAFYSLVDIWVPYYAFSRGLRSLEQFRDVAAAFVVAVAVMAPLGAFEAAKGWLLYDGLRTALGLPPPDIAVYIYRGDGPLRANVTAGNSIVFGYIAMVAIALLVAVYGRIRPTSMAMMSALALGLALLSSLSRGPWVGAAVAVVVGLSIGPGAGRRVGWLAAGGSLAFVALLVSPLGGRIIDYLPFVGTVDEGSVHYRQRLFDVSMLVFRQNPVWGSFDYIANPLMEEMRQGQGIIDIVNSYLAIALAHGAVGLLLFAGPFLLAGAGCWSTHRQFALRDQDGDAVGRALIAALVGVLVTIATVSSISVVPTVYWLVLGMCVAYVRLGVSEGIAQEAGARQTVGSGRTSNAFDRGRSTR